MASSNATHDRFGWQRSAIGVVHRQLSALPEPLLGLVCRDPPSALFTNILVILAGLVGGSAVSLKDCDPPMASFDKTSQYMVDFVCHCPKQ